MWVIAAQPVTTAPQQPNTQPAPIQPAPVAQLPPAPIPSPSPDPLPEVYDPALRSWIEALQTWDAETINQWRQHCSLFDVASLPEPDHLICKALELLN